MFNTDITLIGDAASSTTYSLTSVVGGNADRFDATAAADSPKGLFIKHEKVKRNGLSATRHLVRLERTSPQATTLAPVTGSVHLVIEEPNDTITAAQLKDMITQLRNFLTAGGYVDKLFNDEP
jgi:hypothetical protein